MSKYYAGVTHDIVENTPDGDRVVGARFEWNTGDAFLDFNLQVSGAWPLSFTRVHGLPDEKKSKGFVS
jgi:hypothetical protein